MVPIAAISLAGCASRMVPGYDVRLSSRTDSGGPRATTFAVVRAHPQSDADSALFLRAAGIVRAALQRNHLTIAPREQAELVITLDYAVTSSSTVREMQSEPIWRMVPGPPVQSTVVVGTRKDGTPIYSTVSQPGPAQQQYAGERQFCATFTVYEKKLSIAARRTGRGGRASAESWSVVATTTDQGEDISKYVLVLTTAASDYIERDSQGELRVKVGSNGRPVGAAKRPAQSRPGAPTNERAAHPTGQTC
jgi:hypothetical protein